MRGASIASFAPIASCALLALACSNTPAPGASDGGDAGSGLDGGSDAGTDGGVQCTPGSTFGGGEQTLLATSVNAVIVDETGAPVPGQPLYICGLGLCSAPAMTTDAGVASISNSLSEKKPAFKFGDAVSYAELGIPLSAGSTDFTASGTGKIATAKLAGKPGAALTPGTDATSGDVTVSLAVNADVGIDGLVYATPDEQELRAVSIPLTNLAPVIGGVTLPGGGAANFALVYGVAPAESTVCPPAKVTVALPANLGWAAGAGVEFWITTLDTAQTFAPYAVWTKMSDGTVSADGKSASTSDGQGFNVLESFAIRLK